MRAPTRIATLLAALTAVLLVTVEAPAQTSRPERGETETAGPPRGVLAGPEVEESEKGSGASFLEPRRRDSRQGGGNARRWLRLVLGLDLQKEQRVAVRAETAALARDRRAFQRAYGEELGALQREIRAARQAGRDVPRERFARLQELRALAPRADAAQERIWAILTPEQQTELRAALARRRTDRANRRDRDAAAPGQSDAAPAALPPAPARHH